MSNAEDPGRQPGQKSGKKKRYRRVKHTSEGLTEICLMLHTLMYFVCKIALVLAWYDDLVYCLYPSQPHWSGTLCLRIDLRPGLPSLSRAIAFALAYGLSPTLSPWAVAITLGSCSQDSTMYAFENLYICKNQCPVFIFELKISRFISQSMP